MARQEGKSGSEIMKSKIRFAFLASLLVIMVMAFASESIFAEERRERTIEEIKVEAVHRAEIGQYPLIGLDPGDVKEAFASIKTGDKDEWAAGFMKVADRYYDEAKSLENADAAKAKQALRASSSRSPGGNRRAYSS